MAEESGTSATASRDLHLVALYKRETLSRSSSGVWLSGNLISDLCVFKGSYAVIPASLSKWELSQPLAKLLLRGI